MDRSRAQVGIDAAAANEANLCTFMALQGGMAGTEVQPSEHATWVANASPMFWFNMASGLRPTGADLRAWIRDSKATHRRLGTSVMLWPSPEAHAAAVAVRAGGTPSKGRAEFFPARPFEGVVMDAAATAAGWRCRGSPFHCRGWCRGSRSCRCRSLLRSGSCWIRSSRAR